MIEEDLDFCKLDELLLVLRWMGATLVSHHDFRVSRLLLVGVDGLQRGRGAHLLALDEVAQLLNRKVEVSSHGHIGSDLVKIRQNLEVFLRLFVQFLAEFGDMEQEGRKQVL